MSIHRVARGIAATLVVAIALVGARARAQDPPAIVLKANPAVHRDRVELLRQEFRERREESREARERAHKAKRAHGRKAEPRLGDEDRVAAGAGGRTAAPSGAAGVLTAPVNAKANDKTSDAAGAGQAEQSVVFLGSNGLCSWNDGQGFNLSPMDVQGFGYSTDGGATWTDGGIPLKQGTIYDWSSDPVVTVNEKTGDFYYCGLTDNNSSLTVNGVGVIRGHFSGSSFVQDAATVAVSGSSSSYAYDKQWMCADSLTGNLYLTYTMFTTTGGHIWFTRSTDNGATWSTPLQISGSWEDGLVSGSRPVVGPSGEVYVVYGAIGAVDADSMKIRKSTNYGASFGPGYVAAIEYDNYYTGAPGFNRGRAVTFPAVAVDRSRGTHRGRIYLTFQDCVNFYNDAIGYGTAKSEVEKNAYFGNATPFTIGQTLRGGIATSDIDDWKFPTTAGQTYIFFVDSLRSTTFQYTMRIYCPLDTTAVSRLALSSDGNSVSSTNVHALIVWTAPTTSTYYLQMRYATGTGGYRIRSGVHTPGAGDGGRDTRDAMVAWSDDGATWSAPVRVNDEAALYDDWLPEVAVPQDGYAYVMWFDWRNAAASCFGGSDIYVSRSTDGGVTWGAGRPVTTVTTPNWTQVGSNIAPNEGDYNGVYGGDCLAFAWADGRLGDADIYAARVVDSFTASGPATGAGAAGASFALDDTVTNANVLFPIDVNLALTADRAWPGLPLAGSLTVPEGGSAAAPFSVPVPDTAAAGTVNLCLTATLPNGALQATWCTALTVPPHATGVLDGPVAFALHGAQPNPSSGPLSVHFSLPGGALATLTIVDAAGRRVFEREVGSLGAGAHVVRMERPLPVGVYLVRLSQGARAITTKAAVIR
jgi:hypothetical protein